jgi:hypothetical protein
MKRYRTTTDSEFSTDTNTATMTNSTGSPTVGTKTRKGISTTTATNSTMTTNGTTTTTTTTTTATTTTNTFAPQESSETLIRLLLRGELKAKSMPLYLPDLSSGGLVPMLADTLSVDPPVLQVDNFLSRDEANVIIALAGPKFTSSKCGVDAATSTHRTSSSAILEPTDSEVLLGVCYRLLMFSDQPNSIIQLSAVKYTPGQQFKVRLYT